MSFFFVLMYIFKLVVITNALFSNLELVVFAQSEEGRFGATCGLLLSNMYCFGGTVLTRDKEETSDQLINVLDITVNNGLATEELATKWISISSDTNSVDLNVRINPLGIALPDEENMVLIGGKDLTNHRLRNHAITFNAKSKKWTAYSNYQESPFGERQMYSGSATYIPSKGVALYGGLEVHRNDTYVYNSANMGVFNDDSRSRYMGFTTLTFFDINNKASPWSIPPQTNLPSATSFPNNQASVFDPKTNIIYYLGGTPYNSSGFTYRSFSSTSSYNLNTGVWNWQRLTGASIPTYRLGHSVTMLPSGRDVMLYGGTSSYNNDMTVNDFCYTLNLDTFIWTQQSVSNAPPATKLERAKHSAILVNNTAFIVFGIDRTNAATNSVLTLDVSNPLNISYVDKHVNPNIPLYSSAQTTQDGSSKSSVGTGAIIGIVLGIITIIAIGALAVIFCLRKKKKEALSRQGLQNQTSEAVTDINEVNWGEIDRQYAEAPIRITDLSEGTAVINRLNSTDRTLESDKGLSKVSSTYLTIQFLNTHEEKQSVRYPDTTENLTSQRN